MCREGGTCFRFTSQTARLSLFLQGKQSFSLTRWHQRNPDLHSDSVGGPPQHNSNQAWTDQLPTLHDVSRVESFGYLRMIQELRGSNVCLKTFPGQGWINTDWHTSIKAESVGKLPSACGGTLQEPPETCRYQGGLHLIKGNSVKLTGRGNE